MYKAKFKVMMVYISRKNDTSMQKNNSFGSRTREKVILRQKQDTFGTQNL
jgi:hypothetical protein